MRTLIIIFLGMAIVWPGVYFLVPMAGYPLKMWALLVAASVAALYAGLFVFLGENLIEDIVKTVLFLIIAGIIWFSSPKAGFLIICVLLAGVTGTVLNFINKKING